jgi:carbonic anhydrase/acetyltransferase-like protein (isoleucine patch superfamily)
VILNKIYRKIFELSGRVASTIRIAHLRLKYPRLKINFGSFVSRGCQIACMDDSEMTLTNTFVAQNSVLRSDAGARLTIQDSYIGFGSVIIALQRIEIDSYCEIAEMVVIRDQNHRFGTTELLRESGVESSPIHIGKNVWIGAKASVLPGVSIGDNSVVAASAVITKDVPPATIAMGIPARNRPMDSTRSLAPVESADQETIDLLSVNG